jgi:hypothetical protein
MEQAPPDSQTSDADGFSATAADSDAADDSRSTIVRICLIGPKKAGKTKLLSSLVKGALPFHAFNDGPGIVRSIAAPNVTAAPGMGSEFDEFSHQDSNYKALNDESWAEGGNLQQTDPTKPPLPLHFRVTYPGQETVSAKFCVDDAAGSYFVTQLDTESEGFKKQQAEYIKKIEACEAIILVLPGPYEGWDKLAEARHDDLAAMNISRLGAIIGQSGGTKRVIIAISKYERLFYSFGKHAFYNASDREIARAALCEVVNRYDGLRRLNSEWPQSAKDIIYMPISTYGFVRDFGNPNVSPWRTARVDEPRPAGSVAAGMATPLPGVPPTYWHDPNSNDQQFGWEQVGSKSADERRYYWRPFCIQDPFVLASFPAAPKHNLAFTWQELMSDDRPITHTPPEETVGAAAWNSEAVQSRVGEQSMRTAQGAMQWIRSRLAL